MLNIFMLSIFLFFQYRERVLCSTNRVKQNTSKVKDFQSTIVFTLSFAFS